MYIYYVYAYLRTDGSPYYIGKGKNSRAFSPRHNAKPPKNKSRIVFLEKNLSNIGACALERRYIEWYGRKDLGTGILRNLTEGGDGNTGQRSKEWCDNHSKKIMGKTKTPETILKLKTFDRSYMKTEEYRRKVSEAKKGKPNKRKGIKLSKECILKMKETKQKRYVKENHPMFGKRHSEETKEKIRQSKLLKLNM